MKRKVINWNPPDTSGMYEVFLECMHSVICHTQVDPYPECVPSEVQCSECPPMDDLERKGERIEV